VFSDLPAALRGINGRQPPGAAAGTRWWWSANPRVRSRRAPAGANALGRPVALTWPRPNCSRCRFLGAIIRACGPNTRCHGVPATVRRFASPCPPGGGLGNTGVFLDGTAAKLTVGDRSPAWGPRPGRQGRAPCCCPRSSNSHRALGQGAALAHRLVPIHLRIVSRLRHRPRAHRGRLEATTACPPATDQRPTGPRGCCRRRRCRAALAAHWPQGRGH